MQNESLKHCGMKTFDRSLDLGKLELVHVPEDDFECDIEEFSDKSRVSCTWDIGRLQVEYGEPYVVLFALI
jgi:hypothetical protein